MKFDPYSIMRPVSEPDPETIQFVAIYKGSRYNLDQIKAFRLTMLFKKKCILVMYGRRIFEYRSLRDFLDEWEVLNEKKQAKQVQNEDHPRKAL